MNYGQFEYDVDKLTFGSAVLQAQMFRQDKNLSAFLDLRKEPAVKFMPLRLAIPTALSLMIAWQLFGIVGLGVGLAIVLFTNHRRLVRTRKFLLATTYAGQIHALDAWLNDRYPEGAPYTAYDLLQALTGRIDEIERFYHIAKNGSLPQRG